MRRALPILLAGSLIGLPALADQALAKAKNCLSCHAVDKKIVGPAYLDVVKKYSSACQKEVAERCQKDATDRCHKDASDRCQKDATERLAVKIMKGGAGVWGVIPMPVNSQVNETEAKRLATWVLSLR